MATLVDRASLTWEAWYPTFLGVASGVAAYWCGPELFQWLVDRKWAELKMYDSAFDVVVVTTPFLFTVYVLLITTESGFIGRMRKSIYFAALLRYTVIAICLGTALMVATVPLQIAQLRPTESHWSAIAFAIWAALAVAAFAALFRATRLFIVFAANHR